MSNMMTAADLAVALRARYKAPEYAILFEVRNGTGWQRAPRSADAMAMSLWPSRGLELMGFEVKVSRSDWLRELKDPAKAEEISAYCDRWWVVVGDKNIVQPGELPPTWGLLVPRGKGLAVETEAPKLAPKPVDRPFLAAMLRRAQEAFIPRDEIDAEIRKVREEERSRLDEAVKQQTQFLQRRLEELQKNVSDFEMASGVTIGRAWDAGNIGAAVKFVRDGGLEASRREMERIREQLRSMLARFDEQLGVAQEESAA
ncbi:hypothetical protein WMF30_10185 [Sorangium sp. So ce134]